MNGRVIAAVLRVELIRARRSLLWGGGFALLGLLAALWLDRWAAMVSGVIVGVVMVGMVLFAPFGTLLTEKLLGTLELDRTLPVPTRLLAVARLLAAAVRTLPLLLLSTTVAIVASREGAPFSVGTMVFAVAAVQLLYWGALWVGYGLAARFSVKKLIWLPGLLWLAMVLTPDAVAEVLFQRLGDRLSALVSAALADPARLPALGLVLLAIAALSFGIGLVFLTSGLRRFEPDPLALQGVVEDVPREELTPARRGVVVAVVRLRLRLVTQQIRRDLMIAAGLVAVLLADAFGVTQLSALTGLAETYLPVIAFMMPGAVGLHVMPARQLGTIEGLQQLPFPRRDIALGHLLTVLLLSLPAVVIWCVAQAIAGQTPDVERLLRVWTAMGASGWLLAAFGIWVTKRRALIALAVVVGVPAGLYVGVGKLLPALGVEIAPRIAAVFAWWDAQRSWLAPTALLCGFAAAMLIGMLLFSHGLRTYQPKAP